MNKLIACALLGLGLTQSLVACSDDDDGGDNTAGTAGNSAGTDTGGKNSGGSAQNGGTAGKGGTTGNAGTAGTAGTTAGTGGNGGDNVGGDGAGGDSTNVAGDGAGGASGDGAGGAGGDGAGGAPTEVPVQTPTPRWLEDYCDAKASDTLACEGSVSWFRCFNDRFTYLSGDGGDASGTCPNDEEGGEYPLTVAMFGSIDALAAACPDPNVEDWRCNLSGQPEPKDKGCRDAEEAHRTAAIACLE